MRTLVTLLLLTLVCFLRYSSAAPVAPGIAIGKICCPKYTRMYIPKGRVRHVGMTSSDCGEQSAAIVVSTVCDKMICIDPNWTWAENLLTEFEESTPNNSPPSAPFNVFKCTEKVKKP